MPDADQKYSSGWIDPVGGLERGFAAVGLAAAVASGSAVAAAGGAAAQIVAAACLTMGLCAALGQREIGRLRRLHDRLVERSYRRALEDVGRPVLLLGRPAARGFRAIWHNLAARRNAPGPVRDAAQAERIAEEAAEISGAWERLGLHAERGATHAALLTRQAVGLTREADDLVRGVMAVVQGTDAVDALRAQAAAIAARLPAIEQAARAQNEVGQAMLVQADEVAKLRAQVAGIVRPAITVER